MRETNLNLYITYMAFAILGTGLGINMILLTPAFMPLSLPKELVGLSFLACGLLKLALLLLYQNHTLLKLSMGLTVFIYFFWAVATTYDFFARSLTSLQLPIICFGVAVFAFISLIRPFLNPVNVNNGMINGPN